MGLLDRVKNMFTEEVEVEEKPVTKEVIKVEIPAPTSSKPKPKAFDYEDDIFTKQVIKNEIQKEEIKKEEEKPIPVFFDDKDFAALEKPKYREEKKKTFKEKYKGGKNAKKEEKKVFKPTPIISPVYGVLDKNYTKDEITETKRPTRHYDSSEVTLDDVRQKAYGNLEQEEKVNIIEEKDDMFKDLIDLEDKKEEVSEEVNTDDIFNFDVNDIVEDKKKKDEDLTESDLFDLIDSMYDKGDNE